MPAPMSNATRLLLIGVPGSNFRNAAILASEAGAEVVAVDGLFAALDVVRADGADLAIIDVGMDVAGFIGQLRRERMALTVYACGVDAPATAAVAAIRAGARDYLPLPPDRELIAAAVMSVVGQLPQLIGNDPVFEQARSLGLALASARTPFIINGEPGTGREVLARSVHAASGRRGRFVTVNCAETDPQVLESELFGHQAGAFAGAVADRSGRLYAATDGTLFLGEVALLPLPIQTQLADWLETQLRQAVGSLTRPTRIIASTALDLEARVRDGRFRSQLLARLGLMRLQLPPLRRRGADIGLLTRAFCERFASANGLPNRSLSDDALASLEAYDWPGNIRELEDVVHRAVLVSQEPLIPASAIMLADGSQLRRSNAGGTSQGNNHSAIGQGRCDNLVGSKMEDVERALILETLKACSGNRTSASAILGISVRTMRNKLKMFSEIGITA